MTKTTLFHAWLKIFHLVFNNSIIMNLVANEKLITDLVDKQI